MRHILAILAVLLLCSAPAQAQTLKALMYNTTNGQVVYGGASELTFQETVVLQSVVGSGGSVVLKSAIAFDDVESADIESATRANLGFSTNINTLWTATNASNARSAVGLGATWLTNTNVTNFRAAIGLGATNDVTFNAILSSGTNSIVVVNGEFFGPWYFEDAVDFGSPATTRTNLGLSLPALTNTSNVTTMRALAGSTNTNEPYSGVFRFTDPETEFTYIATVSNGIILRVEEF